MLPVSHKIYENFFIIIIYLRHRRFHDEHKNLSG